MFHKIHLPFFLVFLISNILSISPSIIPINANQTFNLGPTSEADLSSRGHMDNPRRKFFSISRKSMNYSKRLSALFKLRAVNSSGADWLANMVERVERVKRFSRLVGVVMKLENCDSSQCNNGATCLTNVLYEGGFECVCRTGYYGPLCDQTSEECVYNPCQNGGMCMSMYEGYVCGCPPKYSGAHCEKTVDKPSDAWYKELGLDSYVSLTSFSAFVAAMFGMLIIGTLCCFVENKKVELRLRNKQFQKLSETIGVNHLREEEFVNSGYLNALAEVFIDWAYKATGLVASLLDLPQVLKSFLASRRLRQAKKLEHKISRYYRKEKKRSEWWDLYMEARDRMRREEIQAIVGKELNKALEAEVDKIRQDQLLEKKAADQLADISKQIDDKTERALVARDTKVPMTTMKEIALAQGNFPKNLLEMIVDTEQQKNFQQTSTSSGLTELEKDSLDVLSTDGVKVPSSSSSLTEISVPPYPKIPPPPPPQSSSSPGGVSTNTVKEPRLNFFHRTVRAFRAKVKDFIGDDLVEDKRVEEELKRRMEGV